MSRLTSIGLNMAKSKYANIEIGSSEGLESVITEISVEAVEIESASLINESVGNVCASLEAIAEEAQASIADGGLDRRSAGMMEVAVESHLTLLGLDNDATPSMESFGGTGTRVEATQVSVEAIKEKAGQLWDYLVKKFKEAREKLLKWFKKVFSGAAMLKSRAEKVAKTATDKKGTKKDDADDELKLGGAAKQLYIGDGGKVDIDNLSGGISALKELADKIYRGHSKTLGEGVDKVASALDAAASKSKEDLEGGDESAFLQGNKFCGVEVPTFEFDGVSEGGDYLGGRTIEIKGSIGARGAGDMAKIKSRFDATGIEYNIKKNSDDKAPEVDQDQEFKPLAPTKVKNIAESVVVLAEAVISFESDYYKHQKTMEKADKAAEKAGKAFGKHSLGAAGAAADKVCKAAYSAVQRLNTNPSTQFTAATLASAKAALDVCDKSLSQYD